MEALGTSVVVVGTELGIPPGAKLAYVLNDEQAGGEMAARRHARSGRQNRGRHSGIAARHHEYFKLT